MLLCAMVEKNKKNKNINPCAVGPMSIFRRVYLFFFCLLLFLKSIIRSVAMHAFVRGKGFSLVHEFHKCWRKIFFGGGVYKAAGEDHSTSDALMEESTSGCKKIHSNNPSNGRSVPP